MDKRERNLSNLLLRLKDGDSEKKLAHKIGVSQYSVNCWLNKKHFPDSSNLKKIADYMDISIDQLLSQLNEEETYKLEEIKTAQGIFTYILNLPLKEKLILMKLILDNLEENL
jgi:transcriptional regulator with XRE-family HTH domain